MNKENVNRRADRFKRRKVTLQLVSVQLTIHVTVCFRTHLERWRTTLGAHTQPQIRKENYIFIELHSNFSAMSALAENCYAGKAIF